MGWPRETQDVSLQSGFGFLCNLSLSPPSMSMFSYDDDDGDHDDGQKDCNKEFLLLLLPGGEAASDAATCIGTKMLVMSCLHPTRLNIH